MRKFILVLSMLAAVTLQAQNVGIGTNTPQFKLDVNGRMRIRSGGDISNTAGLWLNNIANNASPVFIGMRSDSLTGIFGNNSNWKWLMNTNTGNIALGDFNPSRPLSFPATLEKKISLYPGTTGDAGFGVFGNELRINSDNSNADITLGFDDYQNGFTERMRIKGNGKVGIGTTSPNATLEAQSNITGIPILRLSGVNEAYQDFYPLGNAGGRYGWLGFSASEPDKFFLYNDRDGDMSFITGGGERLTLKNNGNVGIGVSNPLLGGLVVNKKVGATNAVFGSNTAGVAIESTLPGIGFNTYDDDFSRKAIASGYGGYMGVNPSTGEMIFSTTNASFPAGSSVSSNLGISITSNGNTGVGVTPDPSYKMDVGGRMRLRSTPGLSAGHWLNNNSNSASPAFIGMQTDNKVGFYGSGNGWGLTMNTQSGSLNINGSAGTYGQVPSGNGDNQATSWTKLGNLVQTYYRYPIFAANIPTGTAQLFEFGGGAMAINTPSKSRLIISAMFYAEADCGVCGNYRTGAIKLKIDGISTQVFRLGVMANGIQQTTLSNYFFDVLGGNHNITWELDLINNAYPITYASISNFTVMVLPID